MEGHRAEAAASTPLVGRVWPTSAEQRGVVWPRSQDAVGEGGWCFLLIHSFHSSEHWLILSQFH